MAFREQAGRQLLVALYQATTGRRFEEMIASECGELAPDLIGPYAVAAVVTAFRYFLTTDELLSAIDDHSNIGLNRVTQLVNMHLLIRDKKDRTRVRHRRIADLAIEHFKREGQLGSPISGLLFTLAARSNPTDNTRHRIRGLLVKLLQHDTLRRLLAQSVVQIRDAYETVEGLLEVDPHYWLQRGRFEAEIGDPRAGKQFVDQARSLNPTDLFVRTGWADATMRYASSEPHAQGAMDLVEEALEELRYAARTRGGTSAYPADVFGRRVLAWVESAGLARSERNELLLEAERIVDEGVRRHQKSEHLRQLYRDIQRVRLMAVVVSD